jgi:aspartate/methionine/tyrosine aminotransferase
MIINPADRISQVEEYYFSKKLAQIAGLNSKGMDVLNLGIGSPDQAPHESVISALSESASKAQNHGYQSYRGLPELRLALASFYKHNYGVLLDPENEILPLIGSKEGIAHISMAFLNPGDQVLVPDPGYLAYGAAAKLAGAEVKKYALSGPGWEPDWKALDAMDWSSVKLWWVNYPHMPTGQKSSIEKFEKIIALAKKKKVLVINDNPYSLVLNSKKPLSLLSVAGSSEVALELNSLSKSHNMAGWRLGTLMGREDYLHSVLRVKSNYDSGMFKAIQEAAIQALGLDQKWHDQRNAVYERRKLMACSLLDLLNCTYSNNQEGMFVWAKVPDLVSDVELWVDDILFNASVFITPGFIFGEQGRRYVRVSLCSKESQFEEAARRIKKYLSS